MLLKDKKAIVTGGSRGIGRAIALKLAALGADVAVNYNSNEALANEVVKEISQLGRKAIAVKANVSDLDDAQEMIQQVGSEFGGIDILINNAGMTKDGLLLKMKEEDWDQVISTNLKSVFNCTKAISRLMIKQKQGRIINISSVVGIIGNAGQGNYSASKAGIIGFSKTMARELGSRGITVNVIAPGYIQTDMTETMNENIKEQLLNQIPTKRLGNPEDIANLAGFLASDEASYITGQVINVDGGMVMI
ncbi:MAG: 3-oxoacyl-[acyl-carrier-protein] reductase [Clostridia bacterium]|nr:3-oxoacyl-[acyl-carrier-protein] reductase [Clostridia bacterium]